MRPGRRARGTAGFTLLEVLCVLLIMSVAAVMARSALRPSVGSQLRAEAARLASALRVTRSAAMARESAMTLAIDRTARSYASPAIAPSAMDPRIEIALALPGPAKAPGSLDGILFFPSGRSTGADIRLRLERAEARIAVNWATGHVAVRD